jgi:predicted RNA-binding Zn ribbon-like protein
VSLAVELHNTIRMQDGQLVDVLDDRALVELRETIRTALQAKASGELPDAKTLRALNAAAALAPAAAAVKRERGELVATTDYGTATNAEIKQATIAADAIDLLTGTRELHLCGAPGCVLLFVKDHPRRAWCSDACGNRARQARHYARTRH